MRVNFLRITQMNRRVILRKPIQLNATRENETYMDQFLIPATIKRAVSNNMHSITLNPSANSHFGNAYMFAVFKRPFCIANHKTIPSFIAVFLALFLFD